MTPQREVQSRVQSGAGQADHETERTLDARCVAPGASTGTVKVLRSRDDVAKVASGDIVVVSHSHPAFAVAVMKSAGLISERGGALSHICIVSLEMGIPCVTQAEGATEWLYDGARVRLNATEGTVTLLDDPPHDSLLEEPPALPAESVP